MRAYDRPITIAILAMGGQGGGVLADWIVALAESQGWIAQSTSVPGVAQRTGATIYYLEMLPARDGHLPVLSLTPTPGDVDIVMAAEFMEAGRSMLRGLVTPERTTVIASTHRALAVGEKIVPGNGIADSGSVLRAFGIAARKVIAFDMQSLAERNGSVISSVMFGALAATGLLPFGRDAFEATIRMGGKGVEASVRAFAAGFGEVPAAASVPVPSIANEPAAGPALPAQAGHPRLDALLARLRAQLPASLHTLAFAGLRKVVDWQDPRYGDEYLDRLQVILDADRRAGGAGRGYAFTLAAAKHVANAMTYDDVIRVADLKTRGTRFARVLKEVGARQEQVVHTTEYMHPRMEEIAGVLPAGLGQWLHDRPRLFSALDRAISRGRRVRTNTLFWFLLLYAVSALRPFRRGMLRHRTELRHLEAWLAVASAQLPVNYELATEVLKTRRLIKGYSDTHARGQSKFDRVLAAVPLLSTRQDGGAWLERLVRVALADEAGSQVEGALATIRSLAN